MLNRLAPFLFVPTCIFFAFFLAISFLFRLGILASFAASPGLVFDLTFGAFSIPAALSSLRFWCFGLPSLDRPVCCCCSPLAGFPFLSEKFWNLLLDRCLSSGLPVVCCFFFSASVFFSFYIKTMEISELNVKLYERMCLTSFLTHRETLILRSPICVPSNLSARPTVSAVLN